MRQRLEALARYETSGLFNGPKVNAFSSALWGDPNSVVIDAWMYRACREDRPTVKAFRRATQRVKATATGLRWPPAETQAAIWMGARAYCGYATDYLPLEMKG